MIIAGYLGFENSGDEATLAVVLNEIKRRLPSSSVVVLSMKPKKTSEEYGVRAVHRYDARAVVAEMKRSRVFVFGGGSLLQDVTSRRSLYYYLWLLKEARRHGLHTFLLSNGIGPLIRPSSRRAAADVLSRVDEITLRDTDSAVLLENIGVPRERVTVTADTAFLLPYLPDGGRGADHAGVPDGHPYAVIALRDAKRSPNNFLQTAAEMCRFIDGRGIAPLLVPMQYPRDMKLLDGIADAARASGARVYAWRAPFTAADAKSTLPRASFAVGMRLHTLIFAAAAGTPSVGISYDPKVEAFCREMSTPCVQVEELYSLDAICAAVSHLIDNRESAAEAVSLRSAVMAARAEIGIDMLAAAVAGDAAASRRT